MLCFIAAHASYAAGLVFSDGFESGNANLWDTDESNNKCTVVTTAHDGGTPHSGKFMLECNWNGTVAWNDPAAFSTVMLPLSAWAYSSEFLIRLWVRYDADVSRANGGKVLRLYPHDDLDSFFLGAQMDQSGGPMFTSWELINGKQGPVFWGGGTQLGDTRWHKLEIYVKHNQPAAADGAVRVWFDGNLVQQATNIVSVAPHRKWGPLVLVSNWSNNPGWGHGANNHVYWDDVEIYTDLGSGGSGAMLSGSIAGGLAAPAPPEKVSVH